METDAEWKAFDGVVAEARQRPERVEKLAYRAAGTMSVPVQRSGQEVAPQATAESRAGFEQAIIARLEERLRGSETEAAARAEQLRREGREALEAARRDADKQAKAALEAAAQQVGAALTSFAREREEYFAKVEREVVKLALAIAAQILQREARLDPLLLAGAVRVALGQLAETTGVRLRCPADQAERWRAMLGGLPNLPLPPEVVEDPALTAGDCVLEAPIGTVDLGVNAQLVEIGRGFFDLLAHRSGRAVPMLGSVT